MRALSGNGLGSKLSNNYSRYFPVGNYFGPPATRGIKYAIKMCDKRKYEEKGECILFPQSKEVIWVLPPCSSNKSSPLPCPSSNIYFHNLILHFETVVLTP